MQYVTAVASGAGLVLTNLSSIGAATFLQLA
jgi:hypothetical protein